MSKRHPTVLCKKPGSMVLRSLLALAMFGPMGLRADEQESGRPVSSNQPVSSVSGVSNDESKPAKKERHFLIVPIPVVDPTFGTGLIVGAAYFYKQTEEQKKAQPASFTGAAAAYTNTNSWAAGVMQQNYWSEDRWRFTGVAGYLDFKLDLPLPIGSGSRSLNWDVKGDAVQTTISRKIAGPWYVGAQARYLDIIQNLGVTGELSGFSLDPEITSVGLAALVERDTRDLPTNAYNGTRFDIKAMYSEASGETDYTYDSYYLRFRSYHQIWQPFVLAWEVSACEKTGRVPLWDTCRLGLRGFPATEYLSRESLLGQVEARWKVYKKFGVVAIAGAGVVDQPFSNTNPNVSDKNDLIPSYGVGVRYMVLDSKRINFRVDYARSDNNNSAWYVSVTEAF